ncbi:methyltransferase domain-containing protein [Gottschalkia purinilytica]|uniref:Methyltransferase domain-containing protein n=1 Tax=Gottschalkia purinilytica TaxID=1503 RepID=A0A0L0WDE4_GOTPU|nr:class I SAM-dependent methyltransferase [Gottschalkia purinilytica]KNF09499.1 methyltransferase domain-containing protein [Gottschalkia purinilytica]
MGFYEELSKYYDIVFPTSMMTVKFISDRVKKHSKILDIACGTGNYSIELSKLGYKVDGVDLDDEMINNALNKANENNLKINFKAGDMRDIHNILKDESYDMVFCIGNSLVHLQSLKEIEELIKNIYQITRENGKIIIQIVNYDRILDFNIDYLPTISDKDKGIEFIRKYDYDDKDKKVYFNTELVVKRDERKESYTNSIPLFPLRVSELEDILKNIGFKRIELYGSFKEDKYTKDSFHTIVVAEK